MIGRAGPKTSSCTTFECLIDVDKQRRQIEVPFRESFTSRTFAAGNDTRTMLHGIIHLLLDFVALRRRMQRPDDDSLLQSITDAQLLHLAGEL